MNFVHMNPEVLDALPKHVGRIIGLLLEFGGTERRVPYWDETKNWRRRFCPKRSGWKDSGRSKQYRVKKARCRREHSYHKQCFQASTWKSLDHEFARRDKQNRKEVQRRANQQPVYKDYYDLVVERDEAIRRDQRNTSRPIRVRRLLRNLIAFRYRSLRPVLPVRPVHDTVSDINRCFFPGQRARSFEELVQYFARTENDLERLTRYVEAVLGRRLAA